MIYLVGIGAAAVAAVLGGFLIHALGRNEFAFWPPPRERCWQDYAFWGLFRLYCLLIVLAALVDPTVIGWEHWTRTAVGLPLLVGGSVLTVYGYGFLGLDNTYGRRAGLVTDGIYAYTRNPQYIASTAAALGLALTLDSAVTIALAAGLHGLYTLFALNEEMWLRDRYGAAYESYADAVPRFMSIDSARRAGLALIERL